MAPASSPIGPILFGALIIWGMYRRVRRSIGRQKLRPRRLIVSLVIISLVTMLFLSLLLQHPVALAGLGGGMLLGAVLGLVGLRLNKFETTDEGHFYTPNTHIGVALSALFIGRMIYRYVSQAAATTDGQPQLFSSPLTLFIVGMNLGYGLTFYTGLLIHTHDRKPASDPSA